MNKLTEQEWKYIKNAFLNTGLQSYPENTSTPIEIHNMMVDKNIVQAYIRVCNQSLNTNIYDYMYWLRKIRKIMFPNCIYKVKRKKTPKYQHRSARITLRQLLNLGR